MPSIKTGNKSHDDACLAAELTKQAALASATTQAAHDSAWIAYYKSVRDSAFNNGLPHAEFVTALRMLGVARVSPLSP
jgi:hypothetical protein